MKKLILSIVIIISNYSFSQCEDITNNYDEMKNLRTISSPHKSNFSAFSGTIKRNYALEVNKLVRDNVSTTYILFTGYGSSSLIGAEGLYIKLSNGEILRFENNKINSSYLSKGIYYYTSTIELDDSNIASFSENDIIQFDMSIYKFTPKIKENKDFKNYINCVYNLKY